jgi:ATP-dependent DNA ligase
MTILPILYKKSNLGKVQTWSIETDGADITVRHGQLNGAIQVATDTIKEGKNSGKLNATTAETQAEAEALAKWTKQKKKGYSESLEDARKGLVDTTVIKGGIEPMLAHKYRDHAAKIKFPCFAQRKYDGIRCIAFIEPDGKVTLWSRTRKLTTSVPHINKELSKLASKGPDPGTLILDGELYNHEYHDNFEEIVSKVRQQVPAPGHEVVQYHVYDFVSEGDFELRTAVLAKLLPLTNPKIIVPVETFVLKNEEELQERFAQFVEENYEGLMVRQMKGPYENKRSYNLQKVKEMQDDEFLIVGVEEGRGKRQGQAVLVCEAKNGKTFGASPKGTDEYRRGLLKNAKKLIGKHATVQYQALTSAGVPRFPVAKCVREDYE